MLMSLRNRTVLELNNTVTRCYIPQWRAGRSVQGPEALSFLLGRSPGTAGAYTGEGAPGTGGHGNRAAGTVRLEVEAR